MISYIVSRFIVILSASVCVRAASLQPVTSWGDNPTKLSMSIYVPDKLAAKPPIIIVVSIHLNVINIVRIADLNLEATPMRR
jgi:hypothetical protein